MIRNNVLGIHKIRVYSLKMNQKDFVFIFAASEQEAIQFYTKTFHQSPLNCHEYSLDFQLYRGNDVISFRDMRKEFESFPAIAGYFKRGEMKDPEEKPFILFLFRTNAHSLVFLYIQNICLRIIGEKE